VSETPIARKKLNPWLIVAIVVGVIILSICCIALVVPAILAALGPSIGEVFEGIEEGLTTPVP